jgi:hypothetical protein
MWQGSGVWEWSNKSPPKWYNEATIYDRGQGFPNEAVVAEHFVSETAA